MSTSRLVIGSLIVLAVLAIVGGIIFYSGFDITQGKKSSATGSEVKLVLKKGSLDSGPEPYPRNFGPSFYEDEGIKKLFGANEDDDDNNGGGTNGCNSNSDCGISSCSQIYSDYCSGYALYDYNFNNFLDSILMTDSCNNNCNGGSCSDCSSGLDCSAPNSIASCVVGQCGAVCSTNLDCDDNNPLTLDNCMGCLCSNIPLGGCVADIDCDDGNVLTQDNCNAGTCENIFVGQCQADTDCNDGDITTQDICNNNLCENIPINECQIDTDCDDSDPLTQDSCNSGVCVNTFIGNCQINTDCNDNDPLTQDVCNNGFCEYNVIGNCIIDLDCNDGDPLTQDACVNNNCENTFIGNCQLDADCDDSDPLTQDSCIAGYCSNVPTGCAVDTDCDDGNQFTDDSCNSGVCQNVFNGQCQTDTDCGDSDICTSDVCNNSYTCDNNPLGPIYSYSGPVGTEGVGICQQEIQTCNSGTQQWIVTQQENLPQTESGVSSCNDNIDNDCDSGSDINDNGCVDISLTGLSVMYPSNPSAGDLVWFTFDIRNTGFVNLNNIFWEFIAGDGNVYVSSSPISLAVGQPYSITTTNIYGQAGSYNAAARADYQNLINEINELNNERTIVVSIA